MKQYGVNNKRRFSLQYPDGRIERYGTCDPKDIDDDMEIRHTDIGIVLFDLAAGMGFQLPEGTLATNGFYDREHDGWVSLEEFINQ